jgi:hypothetical protein
MAKIYVSSTFADLKDEREAVIDWLVAAGHQPVHSYRPDSETVRASCLDDIDKCDLCVLILGYRYGFQPEELNHDNLSITHLEFRRAGQSNIPRIALIRTSVSDITLSDLFDSRRATLVRSFHEEVRREVRPAEFSDLRGLIAGLSTGVQSELEKLLASRARQGNSFQITTHATATPLPIGYFEFSRYFARCHQKWRYIDLSTFAEPGAIDADVRPTLSEFFIPLMGTITDIIQKPRNGTGSLTDESTPSNTPVETRQVERPLLDLARDHSVSQLVILGNPGAGKSSLSRFIILTDLSRKKTSSAVPIPFLVEVRDLIARESEGKCSSIISYMGYVGSVEGFGFDEAGINRYLSTEPTLLIVDGLDEIFDPSRRRALSEEIIGLHGRFPAARVIVTSRRIGFDRQLFEVAGFKIATLNDLTPQQISHFTRLWFAFVFPGDLDAADQARSDLLGTLDRRPQLKSMAGNPMLLTVMAVVARHKRLARSRTALYKQALDVLCYAWDYRRGLKLPKDSPLVDLQPEDTLLMLRRIAWNMQDSEEGLRANVIAKSDLQKILDQFFSSDWKLGPPTARRATTETIRLLQERTWILTLRDGDVFSFVHRTFLEYLCALELYERFIAHELDITTLCERYVVRHVDHDEWNEVIRLLVGLIPPTEGNVLIQAICPGQTEVWTVVGRLGLAWQCIAEIHPKQLSKAAIGCDLLIRGLYVWFQTYEDRGGTAAIAESLRSLEPGSWPNPVLERYGFPQHEYKWYPHYGDCFASQPYMTVFPELCESILVHGSTAFDEFKHKLDPGTYVDPHSRCILIKAFAKHFGGGADMRKALVLPADRFSLRWVAE